jgi:FAD/FMN-containing dehydrogenase
VVVQQPWVYPSPYFSYYANLNKCDSLKLIFGDEQVELPSETAYNTFVKSFWSAQQRELVPKCVFKPKKPLDVSTSILISRLTQCPYAAKSGGHSPVSGGSSMDGGITISFEKMNKISLSKDKKTASFQPGNTWYNIYTALQKDDVTVIGGRVATVGVGGLTLGGGKPSLEFNCIYSRLI